MTLLARASKWIGTDPFKGNVLVLFVGTVLGQAMPVLASPILTRLFLPEEFGVLGVFSAICMSAIPLATLRYEYGLLLTRTAEDAADALVLTAAVILGMCALALVAVAAIPFGSTFGLTALEEVKYLLPLSLLAVSAYHLLVYEATRLGRYGPVARTKLVQGFAGPAVQILLGIPGFGALGLVIGFIFSQGAGSLFLFRRLVAPAWETIRATSPQRLRRMARTYVRFPLLSSWSGVLQEAGTNYLAIILVMLCFDPVVAGFLFLADRIVGRPLLMVTTSTLQAFAGEVSGLMNENPGAILGRFTRVVGVQFAISLVWCGVVVVAAPYVAVPLFGQAWADAVPFIQVMCVAYLFQATMHPVYPTLQIIERQGVLAVWEIVRFAAVTAVIVGGATQGLGPLTTLTLYAGTQALMQILLLTVQVHAVRRLKTQTGFAAGLV